MQFFSSWGKQPAPPPPPEERRVDPKDGQARTLAEVQAKYPGKSPQEIDVYWNNQCQPVELFTAVANDPFMAHAKPMRPQGTPPPAVEDPFQTHASPAVSNAPFVAHTQSGANPPGASANLSDLSPRLPMLHNARRNWLELVDKVLGPGDPERVQSARNMLVIGPWLVYVWVVLVWIFLQHYSAELATFITVIMAISTIGMFTLGLAGKFPKGRTSPTALGFLCGVAILVGIPIGMMGWNTVWRQYWWLQTGAQPMANSASTPAEARVDAAVLGFWDSTVGHTINGTAVDSMKAVGYKDGNFHCVAPILDPSLASASLQKVNFWAVGFDCCQLSGSFTCDDARDHQGAFGVVMLRSGTYGGEKFELAVKKAEALHGLVSAEQHLFVRWVTDPSSIEIGLLGEGLLFIALSTFVGFLVFLAIGYLVWYFGFERSAAKLWEAWSSSKGKAVSMLQDLQEGAAIRVPKMSA
jgi:hypothetical protein